MGKIITRYIKYLLFLAFFSPTECIEDGALLCLLTFCPLTRNLQSVFSK
uniref:Macaca fascicularis brain cDNA, clone: QflA-17129 n=1 Tax=Macaca fascicularis TaxID=9541 RepID=I7GMH4_MACFA|nr:unnamed protein product [Macaca fascicularis]